MRPHPRAARSIVTICLAVIALATMPSLAIADVGDVVGSVTEAVEETDDAVTGTEGAGSDIVTGAADTANDAVSGTTGAVDAVTGGTGVVSDVTGSADATLDRSVGGAADPVLGAVEDTTEAVTGTAGNATAAVNGTADAAGEAITGTVDAVAGGAGDLASDVTGPTADTVGDAVGGIADGASDALSGTVQGTTETVTGTADVVSDVASGIVGDGTGDAPTTTTSDGIVLRSSTRSAAPRGLEPAAASAATRQAGITTTVERPDPQGPVAAIPPGVATVEIVGTDPLADAVGDVVRLLALTGAALTSLMWITLAAFAIGALARVGSRGRSVLRARPTPHHPR